MRLLSICFLLVVPSSFEVPLDANYYDIDYTTEANEMLQNNDNYLQINGESSASVTTAQVSTEQVKVKPLERITPKQEENISNQISRLTSNPKFQFLSGSSATEQQAAVNNSFFSDIHFILRHAQIFSVASTLTPKITTTSAKSNGPSKQANALRNNLGGIPESVLSFISRFDDLDQSTNESETIASNVAPKKSQTEMLLAKSRDEKEETLMKLNTKYPTKKSDFEIATSTDIVTVPINSVAYQLPTWPPLLKTQTSTAANIGLPSESAASLKQSSPTEPPFYNYDEATGFNQYENHEDWEIDKEIALTTTKTTLLQSIKEDVNKGIFEKPNSDVEVTVTEKSIYSAIVASPAAVQTKTYTSPTIGILPKFIKQYSTKPTTSKPTQHAPHHFGGVPNSVLSFINQLNGGGPPKNNRFQRPNGLPISSFSVGDTNARNNSSSNAKSRFTVNNHPTSEIDHTTKRTVQKHISPSTKPPANNHFFNDLQFLMQNAQVFTKPTTATTTQATTKKSVQDAKKSPSKNNDYFDYDMDYTTESVDYEEKYEDEKITTIAATVSLKSLTKEEINSAPSVPTDTASKPTRAFSNNFEGVPNSVLSFINQLNGGGLPKNNPFERPSGLPISSLNVGNTNTKSGVDNNTKTVPSSHFSFSTKPQTDDHFLNDLQHLIQNAQIFTNAARTREVTTPLPATTNFQKDTSQSSHTETPKPTRFVPDHFGGVPNSVLSFINQLNGGGPPKNNRFQRPNGLPISSFSVGDTNARNNSSRNAKSRFTVNNHPTSEIDHTTKRTVQKHISPSTKPPANNHFFNDLQFLMQNAQVFTKPTTATTTQATTKKSVQDAKKSPSKNNDYFDYDMDYTTESVDYEEKYEDEKITTIAATVSLKSLTNEEINSAPSVPTETASKPTRAFSNNFEGVPNSVLSFINQLNGGGPPKNNPFERPSGLPISSFSVGDTNARNNSSSNAKSRFTVNNHPTSEIDHTTKRTVRKHISPSTKPPANNHFFNDLQFLMQNAQVFTKPATTAATTNHREYITKLGKTTLKPTQFVPDHFGGVPNSVLSFINQLNGGGPPQNNRFERPKSLPISSLSVGNAEPGFSDPKPNFVETTRSSSSRNFPAFQPTVVHIKATKAKAKNVPTTAKSNSNDQPRNRASEVPDFILSFINQMGGGSSPKNPFKVPENLPISSFSVDNNDNIPTKSSTKSKKLPPTRPPKTTNFHKSTTSKKGVKIEAAGFVRPPPRVKPPPGVGPPKIHSKFYQQTFKINEAFFKSFN